MKIHKLMIVTAIMAVMALASCQPEEVKPEPQPQPAPEHNMFYGTSWVDREEGVYGPYRYLFIDRLIFKTDTTGEWYSYINIELDDSYSEGTDPFTYTCNESADTLYLNVYVADIDSVVHCAYVYDPEAETLTDILHEDGYVFHREE